MYKNLFIVLITTLLASGFLYSQDDDKSSVIGRWLLYGDYDCPDLIEIKPNGIYIIYNDCGSNDPRLPITEVGNWEFKTGNLKFFDRDFKLKHSDFVNYHGNQQELLLKVEKATSNTLVISFKDPKRKFITEEYKKQVCF